jgi:drug/metabolite transporter (DMT)-like permease
VTRRGWVLFTALSVLWGIPYLFIKIAVEHLSPPFVVFVRVALAAVLLLPVAAARGALRPLLPAWRWILVFSLIEIAIPFLLLGHAEQRISSSLTGLVIAAVPLIQAGLARVLHLSDRLDRRRLLGLLVGLAGVTALVGIDVRGGDLLAVAAAGGAAAGYAVGPVIATTRLAGLPTLGVTAAALAVNTVVYAPFAWLTRPATAPPVSAWLSIAVLGIVCSAVAFLVFFALVAEVGPARTTVITYVNPAVALALGVAVLAEPVTPGIMIGFPLVLAGSYLATRASRPAPERMPALGPRPQPSTDG